MTNAERKWLAVAIGIAALAIVLGSQLLFAQPPASSQFVPAVPAGISNGATSTQPKITWSTTSISIVLSRGESTSSSLTFTSSQKLTNASLSVVPQIASFVTVQPSSLVNVQPNLAQSVQLLFSINANAKLGTYTGTLQVKSGTTTFPQTVKIVVNAWKRFRDSNMGFTVEYPPSLIPDASPQDLRLQTPSVSGHDVEGLFPGETYLDIFSKPLMDDLEYLNHLVSPESLTLLDGSTAIRGQRADDVMSPLPGYDMYVVSGTTLYVVAGTYDGSSSTSLAVIRSVQQTFQPVN